MKSAYCMNPRVSKYSVLLPSSDSINVNRVCCLQFLLKAFKFDMIVPTAVTN